MPLVTEDSFRSEDCNVLVYYAVRNFSDLDAPEPGIPSLVVSDLRRGVVIADRAPHIIQVTLEELRDELEQLMKREDLGPSARKRLDSILSWASGTGRMRFCYQLEPLAIAGDGTARRRGLERMERERAAKARRTRKQQESRPIPTPPPRSTTEIEVATEAKASVGPSRDTAR